MGNKLYVGNLPYSFRDSDLEQAFSQYGQVTSARVMMERDTGRSKGFGFVEMGSPAEAQAAIEGMNGHQSGGRALVVNEARPMEQRPRGFGGGNGGNVAAVVVVSAAAVAAATAAAVVKAAVAAATVVAAAATAVVAVAATVIVIDTIRQNPEI